MRPIDLPNLSPTDAPQPHEEAAPFISFRRNGLSVGELYFDEHLPSGLHRMDYVRYVAVLDPSGDSEWTRYDTLIVDLQLGEDDLFGGMGKSTRYEVKRAQRDGFVAECLDAPDVQTVREFADYYDQFAASKQLAPIYRSRLAALADAGALTLTRVSRIAGRTVAWHAYARFRGRAMLLNSASLFRVEDNSEARNEIGRANRYLHWHDMLHFKSSGCTVYDLGGIDVAGRDPATTRIAAFKRGFGGDLRPTYARSQPMSAKGRAARIVLRIRRVDF